MVFALLHLSATLFQDMLKYFIILPVVFCESLNHIINYNAHNTITSVDLLGSVCTAGQPFDGTAATYISELGLNEALESLTRP